MVLSQRGLGGCLAAQICVASGCRSLRRPKALCADASVGQWLRQSCFGGAFQKRTQIVAVWWEKKPSGRAG